MKKLEVTLECSALGSDLHVLDGEIIEGISMPTRGVVRIVAHSELDADGAMGQPATVTVLSDGAATHVFQLVVSGVTYEATHRVGGGHHYSIDLVHELRLLGLRSDVRMFQEKDAKTIVEDVIKAAGLDASHYAYSIQRTLAKRVYCIQYRETDLDFVSRLFEHEGVFYVIKDDDSSTHVTFADDKSAFSPIEGDPKIPIGDEEDFIDGIRELVFETHAVEAIATCGDYNFETPASDLNIGKGGPVSSFGDKYIYPCVASTQDESGTVAQIRAEEIEAGRVIGYGRSHRTELRAGATFELELTSRDALQTKYLLTTVEHRFRPQSQQSGGRSGEQVSSYENRFTVIPEATPFRPPRVTARAHVQGVHSAVVTGPGGEIHTDKYGRMKGKFYWDRLGKDDDTSSCWIRVGQLPIGGSMALARMTWEMAIAYFDGDPDRPLAVSRMYNVEKASPYGYPKAATRMAFQTPSSPASGKSNEIRMEDGGGGMEFFVNASKDYDETTQNNKTETIGVNETVNVGVDAEVAVGADQTIKIGANQTTKVGADFGVIIGSSRTKSVGGSETITISGNCKVNISSSDTETTAGSHTTMAALGISKTAKGSFTVTIGGSLIQAAALGVATAVAGAKSETIGAAHIAASAATATETVIGAMARTVGGVLVQASGANRLATTKGSAVINVGGVGMINAGEKLAIKAPKVSMKVLGVANFLGGGGILNMTAGSAAFAGLVMLDASGSITISGNPNLIG